MSIHSCTILVGAANDLVANVHDRMPIILPQSAYRSWLDPKTDLHHVRELLVPYDPNRLRYWPVSNAVNQARNDFPDLEELGISVATFKRDLDYLRDRFRRPHRLGPHDEGISL